jgi:hypothetical protein
MDAFIRCARTFVGAISLITMLPAPALPERIPALCGKERDPAAITRCADEHLKKAGAELATNHAVPAKTSPRILRSAS